MATWVIGDVQGCFATLSALVSRLALERGDRLWFTGDLVNRGPRSLDTLRFVRGLGDRAVTVLGNHDLHLLGRALGGKPAPLDTLDDVLGAPDRDALLDWLRARPLLHVQDGWALVHAGLDPLWTLDDARQQAAAIEAELGGPAGITPRLAALLLRRGASDAPLPLSRSLEVLTRVRTCRADGTPCPGKGPPGDAPPGCAPWFAWPDGIARRRGTRVLFGHWAALGLHVDAGHVGLDTGCVWGDALTAFRLDDGAIVSEPSHEGPGAED